MPFTLTEIDHDNRTNTSHINLSPNNKTVLDWLLPSTKYQINVQNILCRMNVYGKDKYTNGNTNHRFVVHGKLMSNNNKEFVIHSDLDKYLILCVIIDHPLKPISYNVPVSKTKKGVELISNSNSSIKVTIQANITFLSDIKCIHCFDTFIFNNGVSGLQINFEKSVLYNNTDSCYKIADIIVNNGNVPKSTDPSFSVVKNNNNNDYELFLDANDVKKYRKLDEDVITIECQ